MQGFGQELTTFILVRHAEKVVDGTKDPALTKEGEARAAKLLTVLAKTNVSAIYSTNYQRTLLTVTPLALNKGVSIKNYDWKDPKAMLGKMLTEHSGGTVVISGHSNTTPVLANILLGEEVFSQFNDDDYGNLLIITSTAIDGGKLVHLTY